MTLPVSGILVSTNCHTVGWRCCRTCWLYVYSNSLHIFFPCPMAPSSGVYTHLGKYCPPRCVFFTPISSHLHIGAKCSHHILAPKRYVGKYNIFFQTWRSIVCDIGKACLFSNIIFCFADFGVRYSSHNRMRNLHSRVQSLMNMRKPSSNIFGNKDMNRTGNHGILWVFL